MGTKIVYSENGEIYYIDKQTKERIPSEWITFSAYTHVYGFDKWMNTVKTIGQGMIGALQGQTLSNIHVKIGKGLITLSSSDGTQNLATVPIPSVRKITETPATEEPKIQWYNPRWAIFVAIVIYILFFFLRDWESWQTIGERIAFSFIPAIIVLFVLAMISGRNPCRYVKDKTWLDFEYVLEGKEQHFLVGAYPQGIEFLLSLSVLRAIPRNQVIPLQPPSSDNPEGKGNHKTDGDISASNNVRGMS
jgi:hypothetical protein